MTVKRLMPEPDESEDEFMMRCTENGGSEDECAMAWDERSSTAGIVHKTHAARAEGMETVSLFLARREFILSDATPDRMGDVIDPGGWDLKNFLRNPIALFNHRADFPIGKWDKLRVEDGALRGNLTMAPEGTSVRIDEMRRLVDADILRAVSVGFREIESRPLTKDGHGIFFAKQELVETSLVSVPANPNALAIAKSLNISDDTRKLVFAEVGTKKGKNARRRGPVGEDVDIMKLMTPEEWHPSQAKTIRIMATDLAKQYPLNPLYPKLMRLMEEIEAVRTLALISRRS